MKKTGLFRRSRQASSSQERRGLRERGASMVEFALVAPLFFFVIFGGIEMGLMFRSYLALENSTRSVARIASIERDNPASDDLVLERIDRLADPLQGDVTWVVIFNAPSLDSGLPDDCVGPLNGATGEPTFLTNATCTSYQVSNGDVNAVRPGDIAPSTAPSWNPDQRPPGSNVGIHVVFDYNYATGFFDRLTLSSTTVEVIEQDF